MNIATSEIRSDLHDAAIDDRRREIDDGVVGLNVLETGACVVADAEVMRDGPAIAGDGLAGHAQVELHDDVARHALAVPGVVGHMIRRQHLIG